MNIQSLVICINDRLLTHMHTQFPGQPGSVCWHRSSRLTWLLNVGQSADAGHPDWPGYSMWVSRLTKIIPTDLVTQCGSVCWHRSSRLTGSVYWPEVTWVNLSSLLHFIFSAEQEFSCSPQHQSTMTYMNVGHLTWVTRTLRNKHVCHWFYFFTGDKVFRVALLGHNYQTYAPRDAAVLSGIS